MSGSDVGRHSPGPAHGTWTRLTPDLVVQICVEEAIVILGSVQLVLSVRCYVVRGRHLGLRGLAQYTVTPSWLTAAFTVPNSLTSLGKSDNLLPVAEVSSTGLATADGGYRAKTIHRTECSSCQCRDAPGAFPQLPAGRTNTGAPRPILALCNHVKASPSKPRTQFSVQLGCSLTPRRSLHVFFKCTRRISTKGYRSLAPLALPHEDHRFACHRLSPLNIRPGCHSGILKSSVQQPIRLSSRHVYLLSTNYSAEP